MIRLQPDEGITLSILSKAPGEIMRLKPVNLGLHFSDTFKEKALDAYERLITDVAKKISRCSCAGTSSMRRGRGSILSAKAGRRRMRPEALYGGLMGAGRVQCADREG